MSEHRLNEIVIERPRSGGGLKTPPGYKKRLQKSNYEGRTRESLRRPWRETRFAKQFSDHLGPLRRLLRSKVGQHWDDIYSELCQRLDRNTVTGQHVISHVWGFVERNVVLIDDVPYRKHHLNYQSSFLGYWREQLYIHPETGILCLAEKVPKKPPKKPDDVVIIDDYYQYRKLNELWYLITFQDIPTTEPVIDILLQRTTPGWTWYEDGREVYRKVYAVSKRQCNKKEIKFIMKQLMQS